MIELTRYSFPFLLGLKNRGINQICILSSKCIMVWSLCLLAMISLLGISSKTYASDYPMYGNFDIPIEAANDLLATAYYSGRFPTYLSGSFDSEGAVQVDFIVHQPGQNDLDLVEGALYLDLRLWITASYTIDDQSRVFDQTVGLRFGLVQGTSLKFAQVPVTFLDESVPLLVRELLQQYLQTTLFADSSFTVSIEHVLTALATSHSTFTSRHFDYEIGLSRPFIKTQVVLVKPVVGYFHKPAVLYQLHIPVHVMLQFDGFQNSYDIDIAPSIGLGGTGLETSYVLTDEQFDVVIAKIQGFIETLPTVIQQKLESTLVGKAFPIYEGRIIDVVNNTIPDDIDISFTRNILFSLPLDYLDDLERGYRVDIDQVFVANGYPLSSHAALTEKETGASWYINDDDNGFYELVKRSSDIQVQVPAAAVDVEFLPDRIRFAFRANVRSNPTQFAISTPTVWGESSGQITIGGNVSGRVERFDIAFPSGAQVKDFGQADLTSATRAIGGFPFSRSVIWHETDNSGKGVSSGNYIVRAVINTGHKLYTLVFPFVLVK